MKPYKYINENIYGSIPITKTEFDLINTQAFQRLRYIKQLGLADLVFPTANHTRFSHSLGVMHIVGKMAKRLCELDLLNKKEIEKLRIAGLLHDIGHYPLSHLGERVYMYQKPLKTVSKNDMDFTTFNSLQAISGEKANKGANHENLGKYVIQERDEIKKVLVENDFNPEEIGKIITAEHLNLIYGQLIHSGLDADRLDYLLRDTMQTGAKYGLVDLDYIIRMLSVGVDDDGRKWFGIDKRAVHSAEHFLLARYFSHVQVIWHKTIMGLETIASALFLDMRRKGYVYKDFDEIKKIVNTDAWLDFTDRYFYNNLTCFENSAPYHQTLLNSLRQRRRAKLIYEVSEFKTERGSGAVKYAAFSNLLNKKDTLNKVLDKHGIEKQLTFIRENSFTIDNTSGFNLLTNKKDEYKKESIMIIDNGEAYPISLDSSSVINRLSESKLYRLRLYVVDSMQDKSLEESNAHYNCLIDEIKNLYEKEVASLKQETAVR